MVVDTRSTALREKARQFHAHRSGSLGLAAALYPPALLFVAYLMVNPQPRKRALVFIAGAVIATLGFGFALVFVLQSTNIERGPHRTVPPWIDLGIGVLLVISAVYVWFRPPKGPKAAKQRRELGLVGLLAIGLVMYSPSPLDLASLHAIAKAHDSVLVTILSVVLVAALYMLIIEIPVVAHALWPEATIRVVTAVSTWLGQLGVVPDTLRSWCTQADIDDGRWPGTTTAESEELKRLH